MKVDAKAQVKRSLILYLLCYVVFINAILRGGFPTKVEDLFINDKFIIILLFVLSIPIFYKQILLLLKGSYVIGNYEVRGENGKLRKYATLANGKEFLVRINEDDVLGDRGKIEVFCCDKTNYNVVSSYTRVSSMIPEEERKNAIMENKKIIKSKMNRLLVITTFILVIVVLLMFFI